MPERVLIKANSYFDSVTLMNVSNKVAALPQVQEAMVGMGTELNIDLSVEMGFPRAEVQKAGPNDLLICVRAETEAAIESAVSRVEELLKARKAVATHGSQVVYRTIEQAYRDYSDSNLAVISVPGLYAAREARKALELNMNVFLFSDNVSLDEELSLKTAARAKGLLVMGPDCGTAIINGVPLGFANKVRRGSIGIVGASGSGIQQVLALIDKYGEGVTQVIGTGSRDLSAEIGGITMIEGIRALGADPETKVLLTISKPPAPEVASRVVQELAKTGKPAVACFLGDGAGSQVEGISFVNNLEEAARKAVSLVTGEEIQADFSLEAILALAREERSHKNPSQKFIRGLYGGGTLADETMLVLKDQGITPYSNVALQPEWAVSDPGSSRENTILDLGDDYFTRGKPHPMLEPAVVIPRFLREAADPEVSVILFDVVLGYGCHHNPAGVWAPALEEAQKRAREQQRLLTFIAVLVGTDGDPQNLQGQAEELRRAGAIVLTSNYRAALLAAAIVNNGEGRN